MSLKSEFYKCEVLKQLYFNENLSCADISSLIGRSIPATQKVVDDLLSVGIISEHGFAPSSGGRRPLTYMLHDDQFYILSVAMDQFITSIALLDIHNNPVGPIEKFVLPLHDNPLALRTLTDKIIDKLNKVSIDRNKILGIGIGMPGFIDLKKGINYTFLQVREGSVSSMIEAQTGIPVFIDNDSSVIALAEYKFGCARGMKNVMVINVDWGIGLGMVLNGQLFRGQDGFAGEFSHLPLFNNNKLCECGKTGCLETEASLMLLIEKAMQKLKEGHSSLIDAKFPTGSYEKDYDILNDAALKGDQFVISLFSEAGYTIGRGVAILIHLLNPKNIVLSGRGAKAGKLWIAPIQNAINEHCIPRLASNVSIEISKLCTDAELIGAAILVMENLGREGKVPGLLAQNFEKIDRN